MTRKLDTLKAEFEQIKSAVDTIHARATTEARDLSDSEDADVTKLLARADELKPLIETEVANANKLTDVASIFARVNGTADNSRSQVEVKSSPTDFLGNFMRASFAGDEDAKRSLAVASSSSAPGLLPYTIQGDIIKFAYTQRHTIDSLQYFPIPAGATFKRRVFTTGAVVNAQGSENTEVSSGVPSVSYVDVSHATYASGVRFTLQSLNFTDPSLFDVTMQDIADQYAIKTNKIVAAALKAACATGVVSLANSGATPKSVLNAILFAADTVFANTGREADTIWITPAVKSWLLGMVDGNGRPVFGGVNPQNGLGTNNAYNTLHSGLSIPGFNIVVEPHFATETFIVGCAHYGEVYESKYPTLQAWVPSTLSQEIAMAGELGTYFRSEGFVKLVDTDGNASATPNFS